jgi:hypothetical protein
MKESRRVLDESATPADRGAAHYAVRGFGLQIIGLAEGAATAGCPAAIAPLA